MNNTFAKQGFRLEVSENQSLDKRNCFGKGFVEASHIIP